MVIQTIDIGLAWLILITFSWLIDMMKCLLNRISNILASACAENVR